MNNLVVSNNNQQIAIKNNNTNLATSWIAFEVFGKKWLINSKETSGFIPLNEIINGAEKGYIEKIPLTKHWFLGVCAYKGKLFAISDINLFISEHLSTNENNTENNAENNIENNIENNNSNDKKNAYLILLQAENKHNINNAGILIYKSLGLKNSTSLPLHFLQNNNSDNNTWHQQATDKENNIWNILNVKELLNDEKFFNINTF